VVVRPVIACGRYETEVYGTADLIDSVATFDEESGRSAVFLVNRSQSEALTVTVDVRSFGATRLTEAVSLHDDDVYAKNTLQCPDRVGLKPAASVVLEEGSLTVTLPPVSWTAIALSQRPTDEE